MSWAPCITTEEKEKKSLLFEFGEAGTIRHICVAGIFGTDSFALFTNSHLLVQIPIDEGAFMTKGKGQGGIPVLRLTPS